MEEQSGTGTKTVKALYAYDSLGQLIREDNKWIDRTVTYTYDQGGNMLTKRYYPYAEERSLGAEITTESRECRYDNANNIWKDQITSFNGEGIGSYDAVGNPCSYRGKALTWTDGRKLSTMYKLGGNASYTYDQNGDRIKKTVDGAVTKFHTDNGRILIMEKGGKEVHFLYDQDGSLFSMKVVDGTSVTDYYYEKNLQGDIVGLIDSAGNRIVSYKYDSWGRPVSMTDNSGTGAGSLNPFRYRGYFYDEETGWYYLKSRYYDPEVGRFINADNVMSGDSKSIQGYNLYSYCFNNPVNADDSNGNWPKWIKNTVKWVAKKVVRPMGKKIKKFLSKVNMTYSKGNNISGTLGAFALNLQAGVSIDTKGNVAVQYSRGGGVTTSSMPSVSYTAYQSISNAPEINNLNDMGYQIGGSAGILVEGIPLAIGGDFNIIPDSDKNKNYFGLTGNVGIGTPGMEFHVEWGKTSTLGFTKFNVFDMAERLYIKIMEW